MGADGGGGGTKGLPIGFFGDESSALGLDDDIGGVGYIFAQLGIAQHGECGLGERRGQGGIELDGRSYCSCGTLGWGGFGGGEDFEARWMVFYAGVLAVHGAAEVHGRQSVAVEGGTVFGLGGDDVLELGGEHGGGDFSVFDGEGSAEPAAAIEVGERGL